MNEDTHPAPVTRPTSGQKLEALKRAINYKRFQLERLAPSGADYGLVRRDLDALEAIAVDYQPDNRVREVVG